jgi:molybdenum cofactor cytidylyltransferase
VIAGVVLAAGQSARLGRPKQLLPVYGEPLLRYTLRRILASSLDDIIVVIGHEADAVRAAIADLPVKIVLNPDAARGQSTSVIAGLRALSPEAEAVVFLLADQPTVDPDVIDALIAAWRETGAPVVAPRYTDRIGNPVLFDRRVFPELTALEGDAGARRIIRAHERSGTLQLVPVETPAPRDVDTEADYAALSTSLPLLPPLPSRPERGRS